MRRRRIALSGVTVEIETEHADLARYLAAQFPDGDAARGTPDIAVCVRWTDGPRPTLTPEAVFPGWPADVARRRARLLLGYAGWGPGQLDAELTASAWLTAPPDPALVFETPPGEMWERAIRGLGVDPMALQLGAGIQ